MTNTELPDARILEVPEKLLYEARQQLLETGSVPEEEDFYWGFLIPAHYAWEWWKRRDIHMPRPLEFLLITMSLHMVRAVELMPPSFEPGRYGSRLRKSRREMDILVRAAEDTIRHLPAEMCNEYKRQITPGASPLVYLGMFSGAYAIVELCRTFATADGRIQPDKEGPLEEHLAAYVRASAERVPD